MDLERVCKPERGDAVRGLYGRATEEVNNGELGEGGSVDRRIVEGFRLVSESFGTRRSDGRGEERNSSILSVSGTGSILAPANTFGYDSLWMQTRTSTAKMIGDRRVFRRGRCKQQVNHSQRGTPCFDVVAKAFCWNAVSGVNRAEVTTTGKTKSLAGWLAQRVSDAVWPALWTE